MSSLPLTAAVISQLPFATPVTTPSLSTAATSVLLLLHTRSPALACPVVAMFTVMEAVPPSRTARNFWSVLSSRMLGLVASCPPSLPSAFEVPAADATTLSGMMLLCFWSEKSTSRTANPRISHITYTKIKMTPVREKRSHTPLFDRFAITSSASFLFPALFLFLLLFLQIVIFLTKTISILTNRLHFLYYTTLSPQCHLAK